MLSFLSKTLWYVWNVLLFSLSFWCPDGPHAEKTDPSKCHSGMFMNSKKHWSLFWEKFPDHLCNRLVFWPEQVELDPVRCDQSRLRFRLVYMFAFVRSEPPSDWGPDRRASNSSSPGTTGTLKINTLKVLITYNQRWKLKICPQVILDWLKIDFIT